MQLFSKKASKKSFNTKVLLIWIAIVLDAVSTVWLMCQGYGEVNPFMNWIVEYWSVTGMAVFKILWSLALLIFLLSFRPFRKYIDLLIIGYFVLYAGGWWVQFLWEAKRLWTL